MKRLEFRPVNFSSLNIILNNLSKLKHIINPLKKINILDAFAGSGSIGLSIQSKRYHLAELVCFVEKKYKYAKTIKKRIDKMENKLFKYKISQVSFNKFRPNKLKFDIIILDPPYIKPHLLIESLIHIKNRKLFNFLDESILIFRKKYEKNFYYNIIAFFKEYEDLYINYAGLNIIICCKGNYINEIINYLNNYKS